MKSPRNLGKMPALFSSARTPSIPMNSSFALSTILPRRALTILGCLILAGSLHAQMNWTFQDVPSLDEWSSNISYNSTTRLLTITGDATEVSLGGAEPFNYIYGSMSEYLSDPNSLAWRNFSLTATIDNHGQLAPGGTLTITGVVPDALAPNNLTSGTLLTGNISEFEFVSDTTQTPGRLSSDFGFKFQPTGGDLAPLYGGAEGGFALYFIPGQNNPSPVPSTGFLGDFTKSFADSSGSAFGTVAPIPEPSACTAVVGGLTLLGVIVRRRKAAILTGMVRGRPAPCGSRSI